MKLNLGAGNKRREGYINLDICPSDSVDVVRDVLRGLPFSDNTFDEVYSENFLEHIPQTECIFVMNEIWRVLKEGGSVHHIIPMAGTANMYQDPTHVSNWHTDTFLYYTKGHFKNDYYGDKIKGWNNVSVVIMPPGMHTLEVKMTK